MFTFCTLFFRIRERKFSALKKIQEKCNVLIASEEHLVFADELCRLYEESAKKRGTGIAKRDPQYIKDKITEQKAIIALTPNKQLAGFCYIETWEGKNYVANSGLIVKEEF